MQLRRERTKGIFKLKHINQTDYANTKKKTQHKYPANCP